MRSVVVILVLLVLALVAPSGAAAAGPRAELDGRSISISSVPNFYCHDLDYPVIRCHRSAAVLNADIERHLAGFAIPSTAWPYVMIYQDISLSGPYSALSNDYDNLSSIGWNDRISSFKSLNGYGGEFWTDAYRSGTRFGFAPGAIVMYVGDAFNDRFSSVYRL